MIPESSPSAPASDAHVPTDAPSEADPGDPAAPPPRTPGPPRTPAYKGAPLDPTLGPGLGCFWIQAATFLVLFVLTPYGVINGWPAWLTTAMLIVTLVLLLFVGQTVIFLLRLVAADRRSRRRPLRSGATRTIGDLAEAQADGDPAGANDGDRASSEGQPPPTVRQ